jgi:hypothetical protein
MIKIIGSVKIHSVVDLITNSSTEIFCNVKSENEKTLMKILNKILKEYGCEAVEFRIYEKEDDDGKIIENEYYIAYDHECYQPPCKLLLKTIKEKLNVKMI